MADKNYESRKKTIRGKEYTALYVGVRKALEAERVAYPNKNYGDFKLLEFAEYVFANDLIVDPSGLGFDDFETQWELLEVMNFVLETVTGLFREKELKSKSGTDKGSGKK